MKALFKALIALAVIIVLIAVAFVIVINLTPRQLGIADLEINGQTIDSMGFADLSLLKIYKYFKALANPDEENIVKNEPTEADKGKADDNLSGSSIEDEYGKADYTKILTEKVTYNDEYLVTYQDTTLAYIFSDIVAKAKDNGTDDEAIKYLSDLGADIREISITNKNDDGSATLRIVAELSLASIKDSVKAALPEAVANIIPIPDKVFIVSYITISANDEGLLTTTSQNVTLNDVDNELSEAVFKALASKAGQDDNADTKTTVNNKIGEGFAGIIKNLGLVGNANADSETSKVLSDKVLGAVGIKNGSISVITYKAEE